MSKIIYTNKDHMFEELEISSFDNKVVDTSISFNSDIKYQRNLGFGGALTDAACISLLHTLFLTKAI